MGVTIALRWFRKNKNKKEKPGDKAAADQPVSDEPNAQQPEDIEQSLADEADGPLTPETQIEGSDQEQQTTTDEDPTTKIEAEPLPDPEQEKTGYFRRLRKRLSRTRKSFSSGFERVLAGKNKFDDDVIEELEELLITSDIGVQTTMDLIERLSKAKITDVSDVKQILKDEMLSILGSQPPVRDKVQTKPQVVLVVGVNGVGKTTTIGKIAASARASGKKVLIGAADTFRAAAIEQLAIWAERADAEFVRHRANADPAAVAFDAVAAAQARDCDMVLIDTAGRLHTKVNLMEELKKIKRTVSKQLEGAPHEILLVLDATTGQNALSQAKLFDEALGLTGLALTKLDGTAKGGIVISICDSLKIPLQYIGVGEQIDDLRPFDAEQFIEALF
ncbi:MAG: signal recognition particle-docking protein FtsY [Desulfobacteraceae bacterium]|jgi:fused signal recognition particle receptor|nr:signal recognition particle-docking protein FtsY [Desulfobacteraceae bacterium]